MRSSDVGLAIALLAVVVADLFAFVVAVLHLTGVWS